MNRLNINYELPLVMPQFLDSIILNFTHYTMNLLQTLKEMEQSFKPYATLWEDWRFFNRHSLTPLDIYVIEAHRQTKFKGGETGLRLLCNRVSLLQSITKKLDKDYKDFKKWVVTSFQEELVRLFDKTKVKRFYRVPIDLLPIPDALKENLVFFKARTLNDLFNKYTERELQNDKLIKQQIKFLQLIKKLPNN